MWRLQQKIKCCFNNQPVGALAKQDYMFMRRLCFGKRLNCLFSFVQLMATDTYLLCRRILLRTPWNRYPRELLFEYPPPHHFKEFELSLVLKSMPLQIADFQLPSCYVSPNVNYGLLNFTKSIGPFLRYLFCHTQLIFAVGMYEMCCKLNMSCIMYWLAFRWANVGFFCFMTRFGSAP